MMGVGLVQAYRYVAGYPFFQNRIVAVLSRVFVLVLSFYHGTV